MNENAPRYLPISRKDSGDNSAKLELWRVSEWSEMRKLELERALHMCNFT